MKITDKMRLDWMKAYKARLYPLEADGGSAWVIQADAIGFVMRYRSARKAIDAAIRQCNPWERKPKLRKILPAEAKSTLTHAQMLRLAKINTRKLTGKDTI